MKSYSVATALVLSLLLSPIWILQAILARLTDAVHFPLGARFMGGAFILFLIPVLFRGRWPQISLRLLHAALTTAGLSYFLSPLLIWYALRDLPSGFVAVAFATTPIWLAWVTGHGASQRKDFFFIVVFSLFAFYVGTLGILGHSPAPVQRLPLLALALGILAQVLGVWVSRRLFWLHTALDLNFWSMCLAGAAHLLLGLVHQEWQYHHQWDVAYGALLTLLAFPVTGLGAYFYRVENIKHQTVALLAAAVPAFAVMLGFLLKGETPLNPFTVISSVAILIVLALEAYRGFPSQWMTLLLNNDRRQGDRLFCLLDAWVRRKGFPEPIRVQVHNLSIGGVGFRSTSQLEVGETLLITLPLGQQGSEVTLEGTVVHFDPSSSNHFPWTAGAEFRSLSLHRRQCVVEFLARLSKAEEEGVTYEDHAAHG